MAPGDLKPDFTEAIMDRCFQHGLELGERRVDGGGEDNQLKEDFVAFFPCGWNRSRQGAYAVFFKPLSARPGGGSTASGQVEHSL